MTRASSAVDRERLRRHLASTLEGMVVQPDDVAYDEARQVWNRAVDRDSGGVSRARAHPQRRRDRPDYEGHSTGWTVHSGVLDGKGPERWRRRLSAGTE